MGIINKIKALIRRRSSAKYPGLEYAFSYGGHDFFQYGDRVELPIVRMGEIMRFQQLISAGITGENLRDLTGAMQAEIARLVTIDTKKKEFTDALARLNRLSSEIMFRQEAVVPTELLYNYLAAVYIREDENPASFVWDVHHQKVELFKKISEQDYIFFFQNSELKKSISWLNTTPESWQEYLRQSALSEMWAKQITQHITSWSKSEKTSSGAKI